MKTTYYNVITVALDTLGCKVNQAETEQIAGQIVKAGFQLVSPGDMANIYILNTCTVTHVADRKSRNWLRKVHRRNPEAIIIATGCYAERAAKELAEIEGVNLVIGNQEKYRLVDILDEFLNKGDSAPVLSNRIKAESSSVRTRSFIKIQDGCQNFCSYCIVPSVRGRKECLPPEQVIEEIKQKHAAGYKEIVITGVEVGSYEYFHVYIKDLLEQILNRTDIPRIRLSSLQPGEIEPELIDLWLNPRLCRHFHISLQSGSDVTLKRMARNYSSVDYARAVTIIRGRIPEAAITSDIIVGFPGETDDEFMTSYSFCKQIQFARLHVFPYSLRPGTKAAGLPDQVVDKVKRQRTNKMLALADECVRNFSLKFQGKTVEVLFEQVEENLWSGLTENYIKVYAESDVELANQIIKVKLTDIYRDGLKGKCLLP
jgi:threonylcarbamoyladenosine tRNA methylthiotransferase MtaB